MNKKIKEKAYQLKNKEKFAQKKVQLKFDGCENTQKGGVWQHTCYSWYGRVYVSSNYKYTLDNDLKGIIWLPTKWCLEP